MTRGTSRDRAIRILSFDISRPSTGIAETQNCDDLSIYSITHQT
jgi:hypothetical protein